jgi:hypothetical protein
MGCGVSDEGQLKELESRKRQEEFAYLADFKFAIGPSWDLNDHVQDSLLLVGIEGDVVEGGDWNTILLDVDAVLQSVRSGDLSSLVLGSHVCVVVRGDVFVFTGG